jgi:hypothetical protein
MWVYAVHGAERTACHLPDVGVFVQQQRYVAADPLPAGYEQTDSNHKCA